MFFSETATTIHIYSTSSWQADSSKIGPCF